MKRFARMGIAPLCLIAASGAASASSPNLSGTYLVQENEICAASETFTDNALTASETGALAKVSGSINFVPNSPGATTGNYTTKVTLVRGALLSITVNGTTVGDPVTSQSLSLKGKYTTTANALKFTGSGGLPPQTFAATFGQLDGNGTASAVSYVANTTDGPNCATSGHLTRQ